MTPPPYRCPNHASIGYVLACRRCMAWLHERLVALDRYDLARQNDREGRR